MQKYHSDDISVSKRTAIMFSLIVFISGAAIGGMLAMNYYGADVGLTTRPTGTAQRTAAAPTQPRQRKQQYSINKDGSKTVWIDDKEYTYDQKGVYATQQGERVFFQHNKMKEKEEGVATLSNLKDRLPEIDISNPIKAYDPENLKKVMATIEIIKKHQAKKDQALKELGGHNVTK